MSEAPAPPSASRIEALLADGQALLEGERWREAVLLYERVLLHDPDCSAARIGVTRARAGSSEEARRREARIREAHQAMARGDRGTAREILEGLLEREGDRDAVLTLLDRLDERQGLVTVGATRVARPHPPALRGPETNRRGRRAFAFGWALLTLILAGSVAFSWERMVGRLVEAPAPSVHFGPPATHLPRPSVGDVALARAREHAERGDVRSALGALDRIAPGDAAYPYARQLRERLAASAAGDAR
ncbi:MAG TPA: hypothetical protein VKA01_11385 [Vicinamibacteria bacterium]|nr:hypothetical protein [Vicinamibacteria bacterium]